MKRSEYIIWRVETREELRRLHPEWSAEQVEVHLDELERKYNIKAD